MLTQLLNFLSVALELLLRDGGIPLLLGARGYGSEGSLRRFIPDPQNQKTLLMDAARQCQESGFYDKVMQTGNVKVSICSSFLLFVYD